MSRTTFELTIGDHDIALRQRGSRHVRTARILGRETDGDGFERIWLDRLVISTAEDLDNRDGWKTYGAISTVLCRAPASAAPASN